jgi:hypothetical protein
VRLVIELIAIGFPIALLIACAFEATPEGIQRTEVADAMPLAAGQKKYTWIYTAIIGGAISVVRGQRAKPAFELDGRNSLDLLQVERARFEKRSWDVQFPTVAAQGRGMKQNRDDPQAN